MKIVRSSMNDLPSWSLRNIDAQKSFPTLSELRTLSDESQSIEIHICATYNSDKTFLCTNKVVIKDVAFYTCQSKSTSRLCDRASLWKSSKSVHMY